MRLQFAPPLLPILLTVSAGLCLSLLVGCGGRFSGRSGPAGIAFITPTTAALDAGAEALVRVEITDFSGRTLPKAAVTWETSDTQIANPIPVDSTGHSARIVAGQKGGPAVITALAGTQSATMNVTVTAALAPPVSFARDIQPIFTRTCATPDCHIGDPDIAGGGLLLDAEHAYSQTVRVPAIQSDTGEVLRIDPGKPDLSYLVAKIRGTHRQLGGSGSKMPLEGSLPDADIQKIVKWVEDGAPNN